MFEEKVAIKHLGETLGCEFDDVITIEFSPSLLSKMEKIFMDMALSAKSFSELEDAYEMYQLFRTGRTVWEDARWVISEEKRFKKVEESKKTC
jgi:hypothetical protein